MGVLRGGSNKSTTKRQPFSDFKKKTAKVGRKVKSSNVTKIEVASKRIQIPLQSQITAQKPENEQENLGILLKTLQHYNGPARTSALEDLKELLAVSLSTESYISLIFPSALELLFDDERDTRKALLNLLTALLTAYPSRSFRSIVPVSITYICSGLTSLNKGVRRDALSLLLAFATLHSHILVPHLEKLIAHVLALLVDPSQAGGQDSLGSNSSATFASGGGSVSKAKLDESWKKNVLTKVTEESAKPAANQRPPLLVAVLEVLNAVLTSASLSQATGETLNGYSEEAALSIKSDSQALVLRPIRRGCLWMKADKEAVRSIRKATDTRTVDDVLMGDDDSCNLLSNNLKSELCLRLRSIWGGLVLDSSVIAGYTVDVLILVAKISYQLGTSFLSIHQNEFKSLVTTMFNQFPHSSLEASLATPGSSGEKNSDLKVSVMDLSLCDVALSFYEGTEEADVNDDAGSMVETYAKVNVYLIQKLQLYVEETILQLNRKANNNAGVLDIKTQGADNEDNAMGIEENSEENTGKERKIRNNEDQELQTFTTSYSNISEKLFHALKVVTLATGKESNRNITSNKVSNSNTETDSYGHWNMSALLNMLQKLMQAFVLASNSYRTLGSFEKGSEPLEETVKYSRRSLLLAVEPILKCTILLFLSCFSF
jgi:hypothetical protein